MPSAERTAYPRFSPVITAAELQQAFTPTDAETGFATSNTRSRQHAFCFLISLKSFQRLHYFPLLEQVPAVVVDHIRIYMQLAAGTPAQYENPKTYYRHCAVILDYLRIKTFYGKQARHIAVQAVYRAAQVMNQPADLINSAIEELIRSRYELPAFSALDRMAGESMPSYSAGCLNKCSNG